MSSSFKNLQNNLRKLKKEISIKEPDRRKDGLKYLDTLATLVRDSYIKESTSDYMFIKTLTDVIKETKYFGGFSKQAKESLTIIEQRYNYIYEEDETNLE
jgi:hypothetical protein